MPYVMDGALCRYLTNKRLSRLCSLGKVVTHLVWMGLEIVLELKAPLQGNNHTQEVRHFAYWEKRISLCVSLRYSTSRAFASETPHTQFGAVGNGRALGILFASNHT